MAIEQSTPGRMERTRKLFTIRHFDILAWEDRSGLLALLFDYSFLALSTCTVPYFDLFLPNSQ